MPSDELVFETTIVEKKLFDNFGYKGSNYVAKYAIDKGLLISFLKDSQPKEYAELSGAMSDDAIIEDIYNKIEEKGTVSILLNEIKIKPATRSAVGIRIFYTKPNNNVNPSEWELYKKNRFFVQKELYYKENSSGRIDISIGVNGIHLFAVELKNGTTQTYLDAEAQLRDERDHTTPYFKHIIASFAMDRSYISFTANLTKEANFLPFNQGFNFGAGNEPRVYPHYPVEYFWLEVMTKDGITNLVQNYVYNDKKKGMVFPRYHQFTCTNKIIDDAAYSNKIRKFHNYLIQAAPGSGKTLMIAWTAYKLSYLCDSNDKKIFDKVLVISNRNVISKQLKDQINQLEHQTGYIVFPKDGNDLAKQFNGGASIIVGNIQKFLEAFDSVSGTADKNYAVLIDEGHDSTSGEYMLSVKKATMSKSKKSVKKFVEESEGDVDWDILLGKIKAANAQAQGNQENAIYIAFTATPKNTTKELFGTPTRLPDKVKYDPFFHYSMKQAIEEGFILDVLKGYTTYDVYCKAGQKDKDEKIVEVMKAVSKMDEMLSQKPEVIEAKTTIFMNFFRTKMKALNGNAKAMIVTGERNQALLYLRAFQKYIKENHLPIKALIAFSGPLEECGVEVTEESINNLPSDTTLEREFHNNKEYKLLIVADKYTTGFDEDYLCYMMVDNPLHGTKVVQTLSRLNRISPEYPDKKTHIIDYINDFDTVLDDFSEFYADAKYYKKESGQDIYTLCKLVDDLSLATEEQINEAYKYILLRRYDRTDETNAKLTTIITEVKKKYEEKVKAFSDDKDAQLDYRKEIVWTMRRFVHLYEITANLRKINDDLVTGKYFFYAFFLACIKMRTVDPTRKIVEENVDFSNIGFEKSGEYDNPEYNENVEITSSGGTDRKPTTKRDDLEEVIKMFNERMGLSAGDKLHDDLKDFLLSNDYFIKVLTKAEEYYDFEEPIFYNAEVDKCNIYKFVMEHPSYEKLKTNPEFKKDWKEFLLRPLLQEIWKEKYVN